MSCEKKITMFIGKRTAVLGMPEQLKVDPDLRKAIQKLADENCRSLTLQVLWLIKVGLKVEISGTEGS